MLAVRPRTSQSDEKINRKFIIGPSDRNDLRIILEMFWFKKCRFLSMRNIPASSDQLITRSGFKYGPFGPIYDVLIIFGSFWRMQLLVYLLNQLDMCYSFTGEASKQLLFMSYWLNWWLATILVLIGQICGCTPISLQLVAWGTQDSSCLQTTTYTFS